MGVLQQQVYQIYVDRGYDHLNLPMLALGLCEEAGEVAAAVLDRMPEYRAKPTRIKSDLEHELRDVLNYLRAVANAADIELGI